jgi:hypothetical protein
MNYNMNIKSLTTTQIIFDGKTTTLQLFLDSLSPKTEKLSLEEAMDLSQDRLILELNIHLYMCVLFQK